MEGMGLKFSQVVVQVRCLLGPLSMFGSMTGTFCVNS